MSLFGRTRPLPGPTLADLERKLEVLRRTAETIRKRQETLMALTPAVQALVDQVAATRGAVDSQTALIKGIPQMIADAIAKDRAANPSLTAEDFTALEKLRADLADEKTQVELADALVAPGTAPAEPPAPAAPPVAGA